MACWRRYNSELPNSKNEKEDAYLGKESGNLSFLSLKVWSQIQHTMDYTAHGTLQARILEWVAFSFFRGSSQPRDRTEVSRIAGGFFTSWATREAHILKGSINNIVILKEKKISLETDVNKTNLYHVSYICLYQITQQTLKVWDTDLEKGT